MQIEPDLRLSLIIQSPDTLLYSLLLNRKFCFVMLLLCFNYFSLACFCNIANTWGPGTSYNSRASPVCDQSPIKLRKLDYLSIQEILVHLCIHLSICSLHHMPGQPMWNVTLFRYSVGSNIAHPCCGQLTAVKTGYLLTSITWPYFLGSGVWGAIENTFFEVICWQVSSF